MNSNNFDPFLNELYNIVDNQFSLVKSQQIRIEKIWDRHWNSIQRIIPKFSIFKLDKMKFFNDINHRISSLEGLLTLMKEGFIIIKEIITMLYEDYIPTSLIQEDFIGDDLLISPFLLSEILIGSLLQFIMLDQSIIPIGFVIVAKNKVMMSLRPLTVEKIQNSMEKSHFNISPDVILQTIEIMKKNGYIEEIKIDENNIKYKFVQDFILSEHGLSIFTQKIKPILEWMIGLWRSLYNIRSIDMPIPDYYQKKEILKEIVSKAATQGYLNSIFVIKNIIQYYHEFEEIE